MNALKVASIVLSLIGLLCGLGASALWLRASQNSIAPGPGIHSGEPSTVTMTWTMASMEAFIQSSALNQRAALWTAATVFVGTIASVCATLA